MIKEKDLDILLDKVVKKHEKFNIDCMKLILDFIGGCDGELTSHLRSLTYQRRMSSITKKLKTLQQKIEEEGLTYLEDYFLEVSKLEYESVNSKRNNLVEFDKNVEIQDYMNEIRDSYNDNYKNMIKNTNIVIRDLANPRQLKSYTFSTILVTLLQECIQGNEQQVQNYQEYMYRTENQLCENGIRTKVSNSDNKVTYPKLETYFKSTLSNKTIEMLQNMEIMLGKQIGNEEVEISVVLNPAPDHAPIQGHRFTLDEFERMQNNLDFVDVDYNEYEPITRPIGFWNCRHVATTVSSNKKRKYTDDELKSIILKSKYSYKMNNGGRFTRYEAKQRQNKLLLNIRKYKEAWVIAQNSKNEKLMNDYKLKIHKDTKEYLELSKKCKLPNEIDKTTVKGYR